MDIKKSLSDNTILREIGERIAKHRLNRNLTQGDLSKKAGVSKRTIQRVEHGNSVQMTNMIRILRVLELVENVEILVPRPLVSPIQKLKRKGKRRKRASSVKSQAKEKSQWSWGDEE